MQPQSCILPKKNIASLPVVIDAACDRGDKKEP
jgi:hypothetical protein